MARFKLGTEASKWGYLNKAKWAIVKIAPLSNSGRNEILALATSKTKAIVQAKHEFGEPGVDVDIVHLDDIGPGVFQ